MLPYIPALPFNVTYLASKSYNPSKYLFLEVKMDKIVGRTFRNEFVNLDFSDYEKCSFLNCTIHTDYGLFRATNCDFSNCKLDLGIPAQNIARLIKLFFPDMPMWIEGEETKKQVLQRMKKKLEDEGIV
jgi:hypothetical protein